MTHILIPAPFEVCQDSNLLLILYDFLPTRKDFTLVASCAADLPQQVTEALKREEREFGRKARRT